MKKKMKKRKRKQQRKKKTQQQEQYENVINRIRMNSKMTRIFLIQNFIKKKFHKTTLLIK